MKAKKRKKTLVYCIFCGIVFIKNKLIGLWEFKRATYKCPICGGEGREQDDLFEEVWIGQEKI